MARPTKQGLDYFPLDVGFFGDKNIRILKARYRADGIAVYIKLLCDIYKEGYYLPVENWTDYIFVISDEIGASADKVEQIITFLRSRAMVRIYNKDELTGYDLDAVITSHGIQKRYATAMKSRRKKSVDEIKRKFWLLSEDEEKEINAFYKSTQNNSFSEINYNKSENNPDLSENNEVKEKKVNNICTDVQAQGKKDFFTRFSNLQDDTNVDDTSVDYQRLLTCFNRSKKFLQTRHSFAWIVEHYNEILSGKYDDLPEVENVVKSALPPSVQSANDKAERETFYSHRKNKALSKADNVRAVAMKNTDFANSTKELARLEIEKARAELREPSAVATIDEKIEQAKRQRAAALSLLGFSEQDLTPKWFCVKCSDTGFLPNGKPCDCFDKSKR